MVREFSSKYEGKRGSRLEHTPVRLYHAARSKPGNALLHTESSPGSNTTMPSRHCVSLEDYPRLDVYVNNTNLRHPIQPHIVFWNPSASDNLYN